MNEHSILGNVSSTGYNHHVDPQFEDDKSVCINQKSASQRLLVVFTVLVMLLVLNITASFTATRPDLLLTTPQDEQVKLHKTK